MSAGRVGRAGTVRLTRRTLLQHWLVLLGIDPIGLTGPPSGQVADGVSRPVRAVLDPPATTRTLSDTEMQDLVAFAEVLVEGRTLTSAERVYLVEHIEDRIRRHPGHLSTYRTTLSALGRLAGGRMARLGISERLELVAHHRLAFSQVRPGEDLGPFPEEMRTLRTRAVPDLIGGYYGSPAGWAAVGYSSFPGQCGDLTRYVRAEN